jgi:hypothetical protein
VAVEEYRAHIIINDRLTEPESLKARRISESLIGAGAGDMRHHPVRTLEETIPVRRLLPIKIKIGEGVASKT